MALVVARRFQRNPRRPLGDTVWWHSDMIHSVAPVQGWGNVMYIPAAPWCPRNENGRAEHDSEPVAQAFDRSTDTHSVHRAADPMLRLAAPRRVRIEGHGNHHAVAITRGHHRRIRTRAPASGHDRSDVASLVGSRTRMTNLQMSCCHPSGVEAAAAAGVGPRRHRQQRRTRSTGRSAPTGAPAPVTGMSTAQTIAAPRKKSARRSISRTLATTRVGQRWRSARRRGW